LLAPYKLPPIKDVNNDTLSFYFDNNADYEYVDFDEELNSFVFKEFT